MAQEEELNKISRLTARFADAFKTANPATSVLDTFFHPSGSITEHGIDIGGHLPFLGRWVGRGAPPDFRSMDGYLEKLTMTLEPIDGGIIASSIVSAAAEDGQTGFVSFARGKQRWQSVKTGQSWWEEWVWRIHWVDGGDGRFVIKAWEIWADTLSAYLAVTGQLPREVCLGA